MRDSSSRPSWSTPSRCSDDGPGEQPCVIRSRFCSSGEYGEMSGAKIAMKMNAPTNKKPICAPVFRRTRRHASRQRPLGWSKTSSALSSSAMLTRASSRVPDPRVDHAVQQVDDEVHHDEDDREE